MVKSKRSVSDEPILITPKFFEQLYMQFTNKHFKYKTIFEFKQRDSALCSCSVLAGTRATETAHLKKKQFKDLDDRILLLNVKTQKRGYMRPRITFPKTGVLKEFTLNFAEWLSQVRDEESYVFPHGSSFGISWDKPLSRYRIERIVKIKTGKFPHWLRGVHETYYGNIIFKGNAWKLADHMGLKRLDSTKPYVQSSFTEDIEARLFT